jgi:Peptidase family M1 domain
VNRFVSGVRAAATAMLLAVSAAAAPSDHNLAGTIEQFESLKIDAASSAVSDLRLTSGHLTLVCRSGSASLVRAGDEIVGVFFQGNGALEYESVDPTEFPVAVFNLKKATSLSPEKTEKSLWIRDSFEHVLFLAAGRPLPEISGKGGPSLEAAFTKHREKFRRAQMPPLSHLFAQRAIDSPSSPVVAAMADGGKEEISYLFDSVQERSETLAQLRPGSAGELRRLLFPTILSSQPIERDRRDPLVPRYLLTDVDLTLAASAGKDASISVAETIAAEGQKQRVFRFGLTNTITVPVGASGSDPRSYRVRRVTDETGRALLFDHRYGEVAVEMPAPVDPDKEAKIRFEIEGDFLVRPGGDNFWELGLGGGDWFPQPDLNGQFFTWHCTVKVKKPFIPFASGPTVARRSEGDENVLETRTDKPVQFPAVLAGKYEVHEETREGLTIRVATYAMRNERAGKQLAALAFGIIDYYQKFLGPFPFPEFDILEIARWGFGQAPPGVMFITKEAFNPLMGETNQLFSQGVNERFAHEIAHQYWGQVVKMPGLEEQWLTESFAEYSAAVFLKAFRGQAVYDKLLAHWKSRAAAAAEASPIPLANRVRVPGDPLVQFSIRTGLIYDKGAYLLAVLHKELGDQTFLTFLKSYQKTFRWKFGSTKTVAGLLQALTKKDYMPFFEANYWGTGMPR